MSTIHTHEHTNPALAQPRREVSWATAAKATLHCLAGCAIGEITGLLIGTALGLPVTATIALSVVLAFLFGYGLTMRPFLKTGMTIKAALLIALAADTVSIVVMETVDNTIMVTAPGAMDAGLGDLRFYVWMAVALAVAFTVTTPVNRWLMSRGKGMASKPAGHACH